jgi:hypothetical protein
MKFLAAHSRCCFLLLLLAAMATVSGCASTDSDNVSSRPWNQPQGWETGSLPGSMNYGR